MPALSSDAIRFYANEPIYFVEDIHKSNSGRKSNVTFCGVFEIIP